MGDNANPKDTILHRHCVRYLEVLKARQAQNLPDHLCHRSAEAEAERDFKLTADERRKRDAWLDKNHPNRKKEPEPDKGRSFFDDESIVRAE